jgi:hypothetical protein
VHDPFAELTGLTKAPPKTSPPLKKQTGSSAGPAPAQPAPAQPAPSATPALSGTILLLSVLLFSER